MSGVVTNPQFEANGHLFDIRHLPTERFCLRSQCGAGYLVAASSSCTTGRVRVDPVTRRVIVDDEQATVTDLSDQIDERRHELLGRYRCQVLPPPEEAAEPTGYREDEDVVRGAAGDRHRAYQIRFPAGLTEALEDTAAWWYQTAAQDVEHGLAKAAEYGSADLEIMGQAMEALYPGADQLDPESRRRVGIEMAIAFYNLGKAARMFGAYGRGEVPSDDTWHDGTVYTMMARRVRESGTWP